MPHGAARRHRSYSTPSRRKPRSMSVSGSAGTEFLEEPDLLDEWSSMPEFLTWKRRSVSHSFTTSRRRSMSDVTCSTAVDAAQLTAEPVERQGDPGRFGEAARREEAALH